MLRLHAGAHPVAIVSATSSFIHMLWWAVREYFFPRTALPPPAQAVRVAHELDLEVARSYCEPCPPCEERECPEEPCGDELAVAQYARVGLPCTLR